MHEIREMDNVHFLMKLNYLSKNSHKISHTHNEGPVNNTNIKVGVNVENSTTNNNFAKLYLLSFVMHGHKKRV